jgi:hypothetical protein
MTNVLIVAAMLMIAATADVAALVGGNTSAEAAPRAARVDTGPPDTGSEIIECGLSPTQTSHKTRAATFLLPAQTAPCRPCPTLTNNLARIGVGFS